ncbi:MAG: fasciclin domain-containing protein [Fluviicola sp.]|nr:fasciclin domain-containing protein [Fluviicola sp.]
MKFIQKIAVLGIAGFLTVTLTAQTTSDVFQLVGESKNHVTLFEAIKTADLIETLKSKGPFTVFAATDQAFAQLPTGDLETLQLPENKRELRNFIEYHVLEGKYDEATLLAAIKKGRGKAKFRTVAGGKLKFRLVKGYIIITDGNGGKSTITKADIDATNGVVHIVDKVLIKG